MDKVSASQPRDCGFEPHTGHDHYSSCDTCCGLESDLNMLLHNRAKINKVKLKEAARYMDIIIFCLSVCLTKILSRA